MATKSELIDLLKQIIGTYPTKEDMSVDAVPLYDETKKFFNTLLNSIKSMNEELININASQDVLNELHNCYNYVMNFSNNTSDYGYLQNAKDRFYNIIIYYNQMYLFPVNVNKVAIENNKIVKGSFEKLLEEVYKIQNESNQKINQINKSLEEKRNEVSELLSSSSKRFNDAYDNQVSEINSNLKNKAQEVEDIKQKYDSYLGQVGESYTHELENLRVNIQEQHDKILALAGITVGVKYSQEYRDKSNNEKELANWWQWGTIGLSVIALGIFTWGAIELLTNMPTDVDLGHIFYRFGIMFPILFLIYYVISYCAKQSDKHRAKEHYYSDVALKATAIDPYLSPLPKELQNLVKVYVAGELFSNDAGNSDAQTENRKMLSSQTEKILEKYAQKALDEIDKSGDTP